jgi:hypothetical protein
LKTVFVASVREIFVRQIYPAGVMWPVIEDPWRQLMKKKPAKKTATKKGK